MVDWLDPQVPTVARFLRDVGYATCPIGNGHLGGGQGAPTPDAYGFDVYRSTTGAGETWNEGQDPTFRARSTALFVDEAREVHRGQPRPAVLPEPLDPSAARAPGAPPREMAPYKQFRAFGNLQYRTPYEIYYASVTDLDTQVGRLIQSQAGDRRLETGGKTATVEGRAYSLQPASHTCPMLSIREGEWKLLANPDGSRAELYHIPKDPPAGRSPMAGEGPMEADNRAESEQEVVRRLLEKLLAWYKMRLETVGRRL
jgi:hypothetical protein